MRVKDCLAVNNAVNRDNLEVFPVLGQPNLRRERELNDVAVLNCNLSCDGEHVIVHSTIDLRGRLHGEVFNAPEGLHLGADLEAFVDLADAVSVDGCDDKEPRGFVVPRVVDTD